MKTEQDTPVLSVANLQPKNKIEHALRILIHLDVKAMRFSVSLHQI